MSNLGSWSTPLRVLAFAASAGLALPAQASAFRAPVRAFAPADLSVTQGEHRYVSSAQHAQLAVLRPDGTQGIIHLPGVASALFVHENQLYVGFPSGDLQVFNVAGPAAGQPELTMRHRYPHPVAGFALTNGQVVALPAQSAPSSPPPSYESPSQASPGPGPAPRDVNEPPRGIGSIVMGVLIGGGIGVPAMAVGLNNRLDREGDGWGWIIVGGVGLGIGAILAGVGGSQAAEHRKWAKRQYGARLTPVAGIDPAGNWSLGAHLRF